MKLHISSKKHLKDLLFTILFVCFIIIALACIPKTVEPYRTIGYFKVSRNTWGITVYQDQKHAYYLFSPVNDYTTNTYGSHQEELLLPSMVEKQTTKTIIQTIYKTVKDAFTFYTNPKTPLYQAYANDTIVYTAITEKNTITITRMIQSNQITQPISGMTMTWSRDDIIVDENGILYTEPNEEEIAYLQTFFPLKKITTDPNDYRIETQASRIYIINPNIPGVLELSANKTQKIYIDTRRKQIDVEEEFTHNDIKTTSVSIVVHNTIPNNGVL